MLGALAVRELWGFRVKTAAETGYWGRGPVIGSTTWPRDEESLQHLLSEFDDYLPDLRGGTLVVGATPAAAELASELAMGLMKMFLATYQPYPSQRGSAPEETGFLAASSRGEEVEAHGDDDVIDTTAEVFETLTRHAGPDANNPSDSSSGATRASLSSVFEGSDIESSPAVDVSIAANALPKIGYWDGPESGPPIRRAARFADRVLVVVPSGATSIMTLLNVGSRLGRRRGIGFVVVNLEPQLVHLPDRSGKPEDFWFYFKN